MYQKDLFEIMDTNLTELQEWLDFEADMETDPFGSQLPPKECPF